MLSNDCLRCLECGRVSPPGARGWKAEIGSVPEEDDAPELVIYCPRCWESEFSDE
jgi:hypothetical protein